MRRSSAALLCLLALILASPVLAAGTKHDKVARLMALDGTDAVVDQVIARQLPLVREAFRKRYPQAQDGAEDVYVEAFAAQMRARQGELIDAIAQIYEDSFSAAELDALLTFFESPAGRKYRATAPALLDAARQQGRAWGQANAAGLVKAARDAVAAKGLKLK